MDWLTEFDYGPTQSDYVAKRQPGTGQWLLDSREFQTWLATGGQTLFCPGIPGAGKTILTSIVVDELQSSFCNDSKTSLAYIYCSYQRSGEQTLDQLLANILKQLAKQQSSSLGSIKEAYIRHKMKESRPSVNEIVALLHSVVGVYSRVFILVDALDECQALGGRRMRLLSELFALQESHGVNIFATSRFDSDIISKFESGMRLEITAKRTDVAQYLNSHIQDLPSIVRGNRALQSEIFTGILEAVDGM